MISVGQYNLISIIGEGAYATVYKVRDRRTGGFFAMKLMVLKGEPEQIKCIKQELLISSKLDHPNIISLKDVIFDKPNLYLFYDLCESGTLSDYVQSSNYDLFFAIKLFIQILYGLAYLHDNNVVHRDLKLDNILISSDNIVKIADFGLSKARNDDQPLTTICGTILYMSPEILLGEKYDGKKADLWSIGIILYSLLFKCFPWNTDTEKDQNEVFADVRNQILIADIRFPHEDIPNELFEILESLLDATPENRGDPLEILDKEYLKNIIPEIPLNYNDINLELQNNELSERIQQFIEEIDNIM